MIGQLRIKRVAMRIGSDGCAFRILVDPRLVGFESSWTDGARIQRKTANIVPAANALDHINNGFYSVSATPFIVY